MQKSNPAATRTANKNNQPDMEARAWVWTEDEQTRQKSDERQIGHETLTSSAHVLQKSLSKSREVAISTLRRLK
jgi:hypothetical protein